MKILNLITLIALMTLWSCSNKTAVISQDAMSSELESMINESTAIKKGIKEKNLLKYSTDADKAAFEMNLDRIEASLLRLAVMPHDSNALTVLYQAVKGIESLQLSKIDNAIISDFVIEVSQKMERIARLQGEILEDIEWPIFYHDFSDGLAPFGTYSKNKEWEKGWARDHGQAKVGSYGNKAALITPAFDLTSIRNPKFKIKHSVSINQNTGSSGGNFDRNLILNGVFKAYVSTDYVDGDPMDTSIATWNEVSLAPMPLGIDFHTVYSPEIDLTPYIDQNVTIKLEFDMTDTKTYGKHYVSWYVEEFSVMGAGDVLTIVDRPEDLYSFEFNKSGFSPYQILNVVAGGAKWEEYGFSEGSVDLAKIQSNGSETDTWIFSPKIKLVDVENPILNIKETVRNPVWDKYQIMISTDYNGGNPAESTWTIVDHTPETAVEEGAWTDLSPYVDLSAYVGQTIVVAFRYTAGADEYNVWEIESVTIRGIGSSIYYDTFELTYQPVVEEQQPVEEETGGELFYEYSASANQLAGMNQVTLEGSAAEWMYTLYNENAYIRISGYKTKQTGSQVLYTDAIDLSGKVAPEVFVKQAMNYYPDAAQALKLLRTVIAVVDGDTFDAKTATWTDLYFQVQMSGNNFDAVDSGWLVLPEEFQNKKVVIGFIYSATSDYYPNWDLYELKLREGE